MARRCLAASAALSLSVALGCAPGKNLAGQIAKTPTVADAGQARCGVAVSQSKPLIVEWPSSDRAALESKIRRGLVPVRYAGCEMEVLNSCRYTGSTYEFIGLTSKQEQVSIRDSDELYARLPVGAARLEGELARAGELTVDMTIVGRWETADYLFDRGHLEGNCEGATHVISGLTVGAFRFYAGASAEVGGSVDVAGSGAGAGGRSESARSTLAKDGDPRACEAVEGVPSAPPDDCGALLRVEVVALSTASTANASAAGVNAGGAAGSSASLPPEGPPSGTPGSSGMEGPRRADETTEDRAAGEKRWTQTRRRLGGGIGLFFGGFGFLAGGTLTLFRTAPEGGANDDTIDNSKDRGEQAAGIILTTIGGASMVVGMGMTAVYGVRWIRMRPQYKRFVRVGGGPVPGGGALTLSGRF